MDKDKKKAIDSVMSKINKQYGDGALMKLGSKKTIEVPVIPTGSISLDSALAGDDDYCIIIPELLDYDVVYATVVQGCGQACPA